MAGKPDQPDTRRTPGEDSSPNPIYDPPPPERTNFEHPRAPGQRVGAPGVGETRAGDPHNVPGGKGPLKAPGAQHPGTTISGPAAVPSSSADANRPSATARPTETAGDGATASMSGHVGGPETPDEPDRVAPPPDSYTQQGRGVDEFPGRTGADLGAAGGGASGPGNAGRNFPGANSGGAVAESGVGGVTRINTGIGSERDESVQGSPARSHKQQVRDLMTADVEVCDPGTGLDYVARMMAERDVGAIPVVENTDTMRPVGIITDRDIVVRIIAKGQAVEEVTAEDCMSTDLFTLTPETGIEQCIRQMEEHRVRRALVVDSDGGCVGIIAQADIAERTPAEQSGELVRDLSHPPGHQGAYH